MSTTTITSGPGSVTTHAVVTFTFTADTPGTFECSLDGAPYAPGTSPFTTPAMSNGTHTFAVRVQVGDGPPNAAATYRWEVRNKLKKPKKDDKAKICSDLCTWTGQTSTQHAQCFKDCIKDTGRISERARSGARSCREWDWECLWNNVIVTGGSTDSADYDACCLQWQITGGRAIDRTAGPTPLPPIVPLLAGFARGLRDLRRLRLF